MGEFDCTLTPNTSAGVVTGYCLDCPEIPAIAATPEIVTTDRRYGWNASAHSQRADAGDCYTQFSAPANVRGVVCGLANLHRSSLPRDVPFAFYIYQSAGAQWWRVLESGVAKTAPVRRARTDSFRIERKGREVRYYVNNTLRYTSQAAGTGTLQVVACLYSADDGIN